jgi:hypothetical protein
MSSPMPIIDAALTLASMDDVRDAISRNLRDSAEWKPIMWRVRSEWLVALIDELEEKGYPYNATVKREAEHRLGLPPRSEADYHQEGDTLSLLIYNAQCFRRSDAARVREAQEAADGWVRPTIEWLHERVGKRVEVLRVEGLARVELVDNKPAVRPPRTRNKLYQLDTIKVRDAR